MKHNGMSPRHQELLESLASLPKKMLASFDVDCITECLLHNLCNERCFNLAKAAYFVDNPDFDCLQGVAGYDYQENHPDVETLWSDAENFHEHASLCEFNQKVRKVTQPSKRRKQKAESAIVADLAQELSLHDPLFYSWDMKHDNYGIFIFERVPGDAHTLPDQLLGGLCLLGFCPIG